MSDTRLFAVDDTEQLELLAPPAPSAASFAAPRVARGGRSFDFAGYRVRLEAHRDDIGVEPIVAIIVAAIEHAQR